MEIFIENRKAYHEYQILEKLEVGIALSGTEVKAIRLHMVSLVGAYVQVLNNALWLVGCTISPYENGNRYNHIAVHNRKLLCHKKELRDIKQKTEAKGLTAVPLKLYLKNGKIKLEVGIARGKNAADKRQTLKNKVMRKELKQYEHNISRL